MTTTQLKTLNHYPEFLTSLAIDGVINFINNGILPANLNARQAARYQQKFAANAGFVTRAIHGNQELFYNPNANYDLEVVRPANRLARIHLIYNDIQRGLGLGLNAMYHQIAMSYLNIPKAITDQFLKEQGDYQVTRIPHKVVNKPITASVPNERWAIDLIDMRAYNVVGVNQNRNYIFTCVDFFSGKVWARSISNRNNTAAIPTLSNALDDIIQHDAHTMPGIIQCDSEFYQGAFAAYCAQNMIVLIRTTSYTPQSNGRIERVNREIRKKIKANVVRNNNFVWNNNLQDYIDNINNQQGTNSHLTPNQVWAQGYNPHGHGHVAAGPAVPLNDNMTPQQRSAYMERYHINRAQKMVGIGHVRVFHVGDLCRIKLLKVSNTQRQAREANIGFNKVAVHYTPQICSVVQAIMHPPHFIRRDEYIIANSHGNIMMAGAAPKLFFANDLIYVPNPNVQTNIHPLTVQRAIQLNRL